MGPPCGCFATHPPLHRHEDGPSLTSIAYVHRYGSAVAFPPLLGASRALSHHVNEVTTGALGMAPFPCDLAACGRVRCVFTHSCPRVGFACASVGVVVTLLSTPASTGGGARGYYPNASRGPSNGGDERGKQLYITQHNQRSVTGICVRV